MERVTIVLLLICWSSSRVLETCNVYSHRKDCYTQGLFFLNSTHVFESCGLYNKSFFRVMEYKACPFELQEVYVTDIPYLPGIFLQGSALFKGNIYILTWREHIVYKINSQTFQRVAQYHWNRQGWGLTHNTTHIFVTDGSDTIFVVDQQFNILDSKTIKHKNGRKARYLNELEYTNGYIYANIYFDNNVHKIDYETGMIVQSYDGSQLVKKEMKQNHYLKTDEVFNGIAYDEQNDKFLLTGKNWGTIYQVKL